MQELNCIIVDDEPAAIRLLERYVTDVPFLNLQSTFTKPLEALAYVEANSIGFASRHSLFNENAVVFWVVQYSSKVTSL